MNIINHKNWVSAARPKTADTVTHMPVDQVSDASDMQHEWSNDIAFLCIVQIKECVWKRSSVCHIVILTLSVIDFAYFLFVCLLPFCCSFLVQDHSIDVIVVYTIDANPVLYQFSMFALGICTEITSRGLLTDFQGLGQWRLTVVAELTCSVIF